MASRDFGEPGPIIDFQAPLTHTLVQANQKRKGAFEKMFLDGRPPLNVGVTSGGDLFGGTQVSFADVLGDKQFNFYVASVSQFRTIAGSYLNLSRRLQYAVQGFQQTTFFYGNADYYALSLGLTPFLDRDDSIATRTITGGTLFAPYPLSRYSRIELSGGIVRFNEQFDDPTVEQISRDYQTQYYGAPLLREGTSVPLGVALRARGHGVPRVRADRRQHRAARLRRVAEGRRPAVLPDRRPRRPQVPPHRHVRSVRDAREGLQELGRQPRLHLLRRQLGDARLRVPVVHRPAGVLRQRRAPLPADRSDADAGRRARRHPRHHLRQHRRRRLPAAELQVLVEEHHHRAADRRLRVRARRRRRSCPSTAIR